MQVEINMYAVLLAALSSLAIGGIWYAKPVFGAEWAKLVRLSDKEMQQGAPVAIVGAFVMALLTAFVLAHITYISASFFQVSYVESALNTAFWLWLGISLASSLTHGLFEQRRKKLIALTAAHELVTFLVMGLIIGWFGA